MSTEHSSHSPGFSSQAVKVVFILIIAGIICGLFIYFKSEPKRGKGSSLPSTVDIIEAKKADGTVIIDAMGKVEPSRNFDIIAEVSGKVEWVSPDFVPGGRIAAGKPIYRIEKIDYEIAVEERKAELALAEKNLLVEEGQARYAKIVEEDRKIKSTEAAARLRMRIPHIQAATASIAAAKKKLSQAQVDLERTTFRAPFDLMITDKAVEVGNYVNKNTRVGTAIGIGRFWIKVPIPISKAKMLKIPGVTSKDGSDVKITLTTANGEPLYRYGKVLKLLGELDSAGRMARLLVGVDDPLGDKEKGFTIPLLVNAYVNLAIKGKDIGDVTALPRKYVRENNRVYVMGKENTLEVRDLVIVWGDDNYVFVSKGLKPGERVVTNRNFVPVEGMKLFLAADHKLGTSTPSKLTISSTVAAKKDGVAGVKEGDANEE